MRSWRPSRVGSGGVRGGHVLSPGTPAFSHPWENATRTKFALAILASRISVTPPREHVPAANAGTIVDGVVALRFGAVTLSLSKGERVS